ncbi:MAG: zinc-ribbon domain-containing protein [Bacteroidales bacterium]
MIHPQDFIHPEDEAARRNLEAIPTMISMLFFWPVLVTQLWGIIQQSNLDEKAIVVAEESIRQYAGSDRMSAKSAIQNRIYCTACGTPNAESVNFCMECGLKF